MPLREEDTERPPPIANIKLFSVRSVFSLGLCVNRVSFFNISHEAPDAAARQRSHRRSRVNVKEWEGEHTHAHTDTHIRRTRGVTALHHGGSREEGGGELSWAGATACQGHVLVSSRSLPAAASCFQRLINDAYLVAASCLLWSLQSSAPSVHPLWAAHQVANQSFTQQFTTCTSDFQGALQCSLGFSLNLSGSWNSFLLFLIFHSSSLLGF